LGVAHVEKGLLRAFSTGSELPREEKVRASRFRPGTLLPVEAQLRLLFEWLRVPAPFPAIPALGE
jgi:hypothetical protein